MPQYEALRAFYLCYMMMMMWDPPTLSISSLDPWRARSAPDVGAPSEALNDGVAEGAEILHIQYAAR